MIGLSFTSTVRRLTAERDEARRAAEQALKSARSWQDCWRTADRKVGVLTARVATLQDQIDALPRRDVMGRFTKRVPA